MSFSSCRWLAPLVLLTLAACGGAAHKPAASAPSAPKVEVAAPLDLSPNVLRDRRSEPGIRASAKPLVIGKASSVKCGTLTKAAADAEMSDLLGGRLRVRPPPGAKIPAAHTEAPPVEEESRIVVEPSAKKESGKLSLALVARETFQLDPDLYEPEADAPAKPSSLDVEAPKFLKATFPSEEPLEVVPVELGSGPTKMRAYAARPPHPNAPPGKDTALVLALLVAQDDGTLESVGFYVRGETVRNATGSDLVGCTRLAERIASTIVAGPRKLERAAGQRKVADVPPTGELALTVPADYVAVAAGTGARVYKLRPLSLYAGSISVSVADTAEKKVPEGADAVATGKLLGRPVEWRGKTSPKGGFFFVAEPLWHDDGKKSAEILVKATRQAKALDEMRSIAETLAVVKRSP
ncbi:MAG: hypothetical protein K0S65_5580 [Labilithrix sp.]|nr:hypothetical protein [Labilithrix sp.]